MSMSIAILIVLSSCPGGRTSHSSLKADLDVLSTQEWWGRMRKLAELSGPINIFSQQLATRDAPGWTITEAGRNFLRRLEDAQELEQTEPAVQEDERWSAW
jgi:hypothetical protein